MNPGDEGTAEIEACAALRELSEAESSFKTKVNIGETVTKKDSARLVSAIEKFEKLTGRAAAWDIEQLKKMVEWQAKASPRDLTTFGFSMARAAKYNRYFHHARPFYPARQQTKRQDCECPETYSNSRDDANYFDWSLWHNHGRDVPRNQSGPHRPTYGALQVQPSPPIQPGQAVPPTASKIIVPSRSWIVADSSGGKTIVSGRFITDIDLPDDNEYTLCVKSCGNSALAEFPTSYFLGTASCRIQLTVHGPPLAHSWGGGVSTLFKMESQYEDYWGDDTLFVAAKVQQSYDWNTVRVVETIIHELELPHLRGSPPYFDAEFDGGFKAIKWELVPSWEGWAW